MLKTRKRNFTTLALGVSGEMHPKTPHLLLLLLFLADGEAAAAASTTLTASQSDRGGITIRWADLSDPDALDHVAIYSPPSSRDRDFLGYLFLNGSASWRDGRGELSLPRLPNLRAPYQFRLFRWPAREYSYHHVDHDGNPLPHARHRVAVSRDVAGSPSAAARPEQVHLAFSDAVDEMRVMFVCGDAGKRAVRYGLGKEDEKGWREVTTEVSTYELKHMCHSPANDSVGWRDPGFVFDGLIKGLEPGRRYFYKVGSDSGGWSKTYSFISRDSEANETIAYLFGDMGTYIPYNTYIRTQYESLSTVKWILRDIEALGDKPAFISHIGDISYARGYAWVWDHFFSQIEPIAASTPYHVCIGNHEYDWPSQPWKPSWATYGTDGGGECGIPYSVKFRMPGNSILPTGTGAPDTRNLYYSFDSGVVHFVYMSTETNFVQGSDQYNFLKSDLEKVNRSRTPFVVFQGHRPMYTSSNEARDSAMRQQMVQHLEPLLLTYNVTLALWGHVHRYERFCPLKNSQCLNMSSSFVYPGAPVHVVIGMGGQDWQPVWQPRQDHPDVPIFPQPGNSMYRGGEFGYTKLMATREKLTLTYTGNHDGQVHDTVEIFSEQASGEASSAKAVGETKLSSGVMSSKLKISPLYLEIGGGVMFALLLGFASGFLVRRKKEAAQWTQVRNEES